MPMTWDAAAFAKLFGLLITKQNIKVDCNLLAEAMGPECTPKAISHQIAKLKKDAGGGGSATSTPKKPKANSSAAGSKQTHPGTTKTKGKLITTGRDMLSDPQTSSDDDTKDDVKNYSDEDAHAGAETTPAKDRSGVHRSVSAKPGRFAGMDVDEVQVEDSEDEMETRGPVKRVKLESVSDDGEWA